MHKTKNMKNIKIAAIIATAIAVIPAFALADFSGIPNGALSKSTLGVILGNVLGFAFGLLIVLAAIFIVYAGFLYLTAGGEEEKVKKAKNYLVYAVVALVVAGIAQVIILIAKNIIGVQ